jgi:hypothetical protein
MKTINGSIFALLIFSFFSMRITHTTWVGGVLNIELKEPLALPYQYEILNTIGKHVGGGALTTDYIDVSYLSEGFYFIRFYSKKNTNVSIKKFIKL